MKVKLQTPSPAMVMACIALFVALGPAVLAADTIGSSDIIDESILSQDIKDGEVKTSELADAAVTHAKVGLSAVTTINVLNNSLTAADLKGADAILPFSLTAGSVAKGACRDVTIAVGGAQVGEVVIFSPRVGTPAGMLFYGLRVPTANRVVVKVCNFTDGTSPAFSNLPVRVITLG